MTETGHVRGSIVLVALFLATGLALEAVIGLRVQGWVDDALQREFLRLGHAHGGLLALVNLAAAWAMRTLHTPPSWAARIRLALLASPPIVGLGFVGGGLWHGPGDPGPLVLLVPAGALLALGGLCAIAVLRK